jgi:transcriptional regulator GlxA family with amidase domain
VIIAIGYLEAFDLSFMSSLCNQYDHFLWLKKVGIETLLRADGTSYLGSRAVPRMAIVLFDGALVSSLGAFSDLARASKRYVIDLYGAVDLMKEESFEVVNATVLGHSSTSVTMAGGGTWTASGLVGGDIDYDMVVLADFETAGRLERDYSPLSDERLNAWLKRQRASGARIAASGAACLVLAEAGLLHGKRATTSWWLQRAFHERFTDVKLDVENALTEDDGLFCSCGIASDQALALRLLERVVAGNLSRYLARRYGIDRSPLNASAAALTSPHIEPDQLVSRAEHWLQENYVRAVRIQDLAAAMSVSRRTLVRHFSAALGITPIDYLHRLRISDARLLLERSTFTISRIAALVGYSDFNYFRQLFIRTVGMPPKLYRAEKRKQVPVEGPA